MKTSTGNQEEDWEEWESSECIRKNKIVNNHAASLAEHFDYVQIITTDYCGQTGTGIYESGRGNFYGRRDAVKEWLRGTKKK